MKNKNKPNHGYAFGSTPQENHSHANPKAQARRGVLKTGKAEGNNNANANPNKVR